MIQPVVAEPAPVLMKEPNPLLQRHEECRQRARRAKLVDPRIPHRGLTHRECLVGAKRRIDSSEQLAGFSNPPVVLQRIGRIVRRAHNCDAIRFENAMYRHRRQLLIRLIPDFLRGRFVEQLVDAEEPFQFEVRPVIKRVTQRVRDGAGVGEEFFPIAGVARAVLLGHAVGTHRPPFVVIARQPDLVQVAKDFVVRNLVGWQMAVIVEDRLRFRVVVVQLARHCVLEKKILGDERLHGLTPQSGARGVW